MEIAKRKRLHKYYKTYSVYEYTPHLLYTPSMTCIRLYSGMATTTGIKNKSCTDTLWILRQKNKLLVVNEKFQNNKHIEARINQLQTHYWIPVGLLCCCIIYYLLPCCLYCLSLSRQVLQVWVFNR